LVGILTKNKKQIAKNAINSNNNLILIKF